MKRRRRRQNVCSIAYLGEIEEAVEAVNDSPSCPDITEVKYTVEEGYYPFEWSHYVDLSDVHEQRRHGATVWAFGELAKRGFITNSVEFDPPRLHVVRADRLVKQLSGV